MSETKENTLDTSSNENQDINIKENDKKMQQDDNSNNKTEQTDKSEETTSEQAKQQSEQTEKSSILGKRKERDDNDDTHEKNDNGNDNDNENKNGQSNSNNFGDISWENTEVDKLNGKEIIQLLRNRNVGRTPSLKEEKVKILKDQYKVVIDYQELTKDGLIAELHLRGLNDDQAKKEILLARLNGESVEVEPPKKKPRVISSRVKKQPKKAQVYVLLYRPEISKETDHKSEENENNNNNNENKNMNINAIQSLGVFKDEQYAYEACVDKLLKDIETKNKEEHSKTVESLHNFDDDAYKKKLEVIEKALSSIFGNNNQPKVWIESTTIH